MPRKKIHLIKAAQARPFIETASRLGVPVKLLARRIGFPLKSVQKCEGVIGELSLWRFVQLASSYPGCAHLGYTTALDHPIDKDAELGGMAITLAPSLDEILEMFFNMVVNESDSCDYQLLSQNGETWFVRRLVIDDVADGWQPELYVLTIIIQIIRLCAAGDWLPGKIRIATRQLPESIPAEWSSVDIEWGCPRTELLIEKETLKLSPRFTDTNKRSSTSTKHTERNVLYIQDLVDRQIWAKHTGLDKAAKELGMSSTTLKRRLADMNTSYSEILAERRLHHGISLLENSDLSVKRIAEDLGYSAVSNYSRAFSKVLGTSPSNWRKDRFGSQ